MEQTLVRTSGRDKFTVGAEWLEGFGFPREVFEPRDEQETLEEGFGTYWSQHGGKRKIEAIQIARSAVMAESPEEFRTEFQNLERTTFLDVTETHLDQQILQDLAINRFSDTSVFAIPKTPLPSNQTSATFRRGDTRWYLQRYRERDHFSKIPYLAQYALQYCKKQQFPFQRYWLCEAFPEEAQKDPVILGEWKVGENCALFTLCRW